VSKISLAPDASGSGIFTIASPNSNTNRTLTLPDDTGTLALAGAAPDKIEEGDSKVEVTDAGTGKVEITVDNVEVADFTAGAIVFNETGANQDFRVEGDTDANLLFVDAGTNNIGIGTSSPNNTAKVQVNVTPVTPDTGSPPAGSLFSIVGGTTTVGNGPVLQLQNVSGAKETSWRLSAVTASGNNGDLAFYGYAGGVTVPERMRLTAAGNLNVVGALSKGSGSFKIDHPLKPETHHLIHSFIEGPQADLIYRGKVELVDGRAEVNIDTVVGMTEGTFVALNCEVQCFTSNESDWDAVRGSVTGNILTIECQNAESTATISWLVIGERQDQHMYDTDWTDENGKVIVEPLKPVEEVVAPTEEPEVDEGQ